MSPSTTPVAFFTELYKRMSLKSPKFFQVFQTVGIIATAIGFIPDVIRWLDITPNEIFGRWLTIALKVAGAITWFLAKLPVENAAHVVNTTDKMPYTEAAKTAAKEAIEVTKS